jgi:indolepyruvate ferredoxin oxidoreductase alpha subunit
MQERLTKLEEYVETCPLNQIIEGEKEFGVVTSGVAYQYAREVFPKASFLKLGMTYPLPRKLLQDFASQVKQIIVVEELEPFLQENLQSMGIEVVGKEFIPRVGELNPDIIYQAGQKMGLLPNAPRREIENSVDLPRRPPLLCPGCPHTGIFFVLSSLGQRTKLTKAKDKILADSPLIITGDIGCYTLGTYPPLLAMDTCACMGASISAALGMDKANVDKKIIAVIGDSTFLHSGITGLVNGVYNNAGITLVILDNGTTAMTGHQEHPGTGFSAQGKEAGKVDIERLVRGIGVKDVRVIDAFDMKALRSNLRSALEKPELSVLIVRGACSVQLSKRGQPRVIDIDICNLCGACLLLGCSAIQKTGAEIHIEPALCVGDTCAVCQQVCPKDAISAVDKLK